MSAAMTFARLHFRRLTRADRLALVGTPIRWEAGVRNAFQVVAGKSRGDVVRSTDSPDQVGFCQSRSLPGEAAKLPLTATLSRKRVRTPRVAATATRRLVWRQPAVGRRDRERESAGDGVADRRQRTVGRPRFKVRLTASRFGRCRSAIGDSRSFPRWKPLQETEMACSGKVQSRSAWWLANVASIGLQISGISFASSSNRDGSDDFPGAIRSIPESYNRQLFAEGTGLLPVQLDSPLDESISGLLLEENSPSPVDGMLRRLSPAVLGRIKTSTSDIRFDCPSLRRPEVQRSGPLETMRRPRRPWCGKRSDEDEFCSGRSPPTKAGATGRRSPVMSWQCGRSRRPSLVPMRERTN